MAKMCANFLKIVLKELVSKPFVCLSTHLFAEVMNILRPLSKFYSMFSECSSFGGITFAFVVFGILFKCLVIIGCLGK